MADRQDLRKWGAMARGALLRPLLMPLSPLMFFVSMASYVPVSRWRQRRRYRAVARALGLPRGKVVSWTYTESRSPGSVLPDLTLQVSAMRSGAWEDLLAELAGRARALGYAVPDLSADRQLRRIQIPPRPQDQMPGVAMSFFSPGEMIAPSDAVIPDGWAGVYAVLRR